jgi:flagellar biosynthesis/type III secretory pathway protein FliH
MKKSEKIALYFLAIIILGSLIGIIIAQQQSINKTENQKLYDNAYIEGYNKGFNAGTKKTVETFDSIRNSKNN